MPHHHVHIMCTEVTPECPVSATTYGYAPELASNIVLLVIFGVCTIAQLVLGIKYKLRAFTFAVTVGCLGETIGYAGRIMLHYNAWSQTGFKTEIVCLVLSPSFLAAGIYLTLKHLVIYFGAEKSRIRPGLYTAVFISCDVASILMQAAGGGVAASNEVNLVNIGDDIIVAGISFQVFTMFICLCLAADFGLQVLKHHSKRAATGAEIAEAREMPRSFRYYAVCSAIAFLLIFVRCVYRVPEMAGGWGNPLMQNEVEFMILDGAMIAIASILMTIAHPGIFFPAISSRYHKRNAKVSDTETSAEIKASEESDERKM